MTTRRGFLLGVAGVAVAPVAVAAVTRKPVRTTEVVTKSVAEYEVPSVGENFVVFCHSDLERDLIALQQKFDASHAIQELNRNRVMRASSGRQYGTRPMPRW